MPAELSPVQRLAIARAANRPGIDEIIPALFSDWFECRGDRLYGEDPAVRGGIAMFHGRPVTVIATRKGRTLEENLPRHFGMPEPEGYRKALRLMRQAGKFHRPVLTFINTPGANPGAGAEARGQGEAIARCLLELSRIAVPTVAVITGEANSGGALALAMADKILMQENAVYAILSPEGFASILWKDAARAEEACSLMQMTAPELYGYGLIDGIIPEPPGGAQADPARALKDLDTALQEALAGLEKLSVRALLAARYKKYRAIGAMPPGKEAT